MDFLIVAGIALNGMLFLALGGLALVHAAREPSARVRSLEYALSLVCGAFVLGAVQRLGLQAYRRGLLSGEGFEQLLFEWQLAKSVMALTFGLAAVALLTRSFQSLKDSERVVRVFTEHVGVAPAVSDLGLTPRELEILELIGTGRLSDADIADVLNISPHTARTHVRNIMTKAGMGARRDLLLLIRDPV